MRRALAVLALLSSVVAPGLAQRGGAQVRSVAAARGNTTRADSIAALATGSAAALIITTEPNSVRVLAISIPPEIRGRKGHYVFVRQSQLNVQGRLEGAVNSDSSQGPIVLNVSVPSTAPAGRMAVGVMQFTCDDGCDPIEVPVYLEVQTRSALQVEPSRPLVGTSGSRVSTELIVRNMGNATEPVNVQLRMPNDWRSRVLVPLPLRLAAGITAMVPIEIIVPDDAGMGDYGVEIHVSSPAGGDALAGLTVRIGGGQKGAIGWRPMLEASVGVARDESGNTATAYGADLSGEVMPSVFANGRASLVRDADGTPPLTQRSLGRLGYSSSSSSYLTLNAPTWEAGGGALGLSAGSIAGVGLWGEGVNGRVTVDAWRGGLFDVEPSAGGHLLVADAAHRLGPTWTGLVFGDLRDNVGSGRYAQTIAGSVELPLADGDMSVQAGRRGSDSTGGLAWLAHFQRHTHDWAFNILAEHAPSGASAFSSAQNQYQIDGYRKLTPLLSLGGSYWGNRDDGVTGNSDFNSAGWTVSPQVTLGRFGSLAFEGRSSNSSGKSEVGVFGDKDTEYKASWFGGFWRVQTNFGVSSGTLERTSALSEDLSVDSKAPRNVVFGSASLMTRFGSWQLDASSEKTGAGVGIPTRQLTASLLVDQVPVWPGVAYLRGQVLSYYLAATGQTSVSQVVGLEFKLGGSFRFSVDAEHNNLQLGNGDASWVVSAKIRRAVGLPSIRNGALRGIVYSDLNGNGKRDRNEQGVPGAVVLIDGEPVTTDASGRFPVNQGRSSDFQVDPRSLPMGWIAGSRPMITPTTGDIELSIIPTSPVEVTLKFASTEGLDTAKVRFDRAIVVLSDSAGRKWTGAANAQGVMRFDALPPGSYEVSADLSAVGETLVLPAELPTVRVEGAGPPIKVRLEVSPRKIRLTPPGGGRRVPPVVPPPVPPPGASR